MALLDEETRKILRDRFAENLKDDVEVLVFTDPSSSSPGHEEYSNFASGLMKELCELERRIKCRSLGPDDEIAKKHGLKTSPSILLGADKGHRIMFNGAPAGYEIQSLIETILMVSGNSSGFSDEVSKKLAGLKKDIRIQVFVTPTCPYCPRSVILANRIALASSGRVAAECVEAQENPELSQKFNVSSVPQQVINGGTVTVGVQPDEAFLQSVLQEGNT